MSKVVATGAVWDVEIEQAAKEAGRRHMGAADHAAHPSAASCDPLYTEREAADYLRVSVRTLQAWRWRGGGARFVRVGGRAIRYRRSDLDAFLAAGERWSTSEGV